MYILITTTTRDGEVQRRLINTNRVCQFHEVRTEFGIKTLIKFFPDEEGGSKEKPIFANEKIEDLMKLISPPAKKARK